MPLYRRKKFQPDTTAAPDHTLHLWILRILVPLGGQREFLRDRRFSENNICIALGLKAWPDDLDEDDDPESLLAALREHYRIAEEEWAEEPAGVTPLRTNITHLGGLVGLSPVDAQLLEFTVVLNNNSLLQEATTFLGDMTTERMCRVLSVILDLPEAALRAALSPQGILSRSGLLSVDRRGEIALRQKLDLLTGEFADLMSSPGIDPVRLLRGTVLTPEAPNLALTDFTHVQSSLDILRPYLRHVLATRQHGCNILLHGVPGTGKSQLTRVLAKDLGCALFEVSGEDADGDPITGESRLRAYRAAQYFFGQHHTMIVFDEAEDVFDDGSRLFARSSGAMPRKGWFNRMLEENLAPTLWLSNSILGLDPAVVRRFDMIIELPVPPRTQRIRILQDSCADLLGTAGITRLAECEYLAPAVVARAANVIRTIQGELTAPERAEALEHMIGSTLQAQGHQPLSHQGNDRLPRHYSLAYLQADADLQEVASGLRTAGAARLCLYGPPGTGKTAYGRWLARTLGRPLLVRRASDLMSAYVGENEQNIARTFREATRDKALLMIDEVDSFLLDRREAHAGWEARMANEMLTQMETFDGIFIASTNLMDGIDQAALRRFDLKIRFDCLLPEQAWRLFCQTCTELGLPPPEPALQYQIRALPQLTPGDFATVQRQHRFRPVRTPALLAAALAAECSLKETRGTAIGFVRT